VLPPATPDVFLASLYVPGPAPRTLLARTAPEQPSVSIYDVALASLRELDQGHPDEAGQLLAGLAALQAEDGSLPFSFRLPRPGGGPPYVRSGAMAWVGYAAARYLDASQEGPARGEIITMAHEIAKYLLAHQVQQPGNAREGLILGGSGTYRYAMVDGQIKETFVPGEVAWVSTEHNIDAYFFLEALARTTSNARYHDEAQKLAKSLLKLWSDEAGQFWQGATAEGPDRSYALDCASWGAVFLQATNQPDRAAKAYASAEGRYATADPTAYVLGHKPYVKRPLIESRALAQALKLETSWDDYRAVWPEGSAGVALAALRLGHPERARSILEELDRLRLPTGGLPGLTRTIPTEFDQAPALAGTAWAALVASELNQAPGALKLWK
jgi:hypothetical protein